MLEKSKKGRLFNMRKFILLSLLALVLLLLVGCKPDEVVVTVNGQQITESEFRDRMWFSYYVLTLGGSLEDFGTDRQTFAEQMQVDLVRELIVEQQAANLGLTVTEDQIQNEIELAFIPDRALTSIDDNVYEANYKEFIDDMVNATGITAKRARELYTSRVRLVLLSQQISESIVVPETYIDAVEAAHILVATQDEALDVISRLNNNESFEALAIELSLDTDSGPTGGNLGWIPRGLTAPGFEDSLFTLEIGMFSDPLETEFGWHILKALDVREQSVPDTELAQLRFEGFTKLVDLWESESEITLADDWLDYVPDFP